MVDPSPKLRTALEGIQRQLQALDVARTEMLNYINLLAAHAHSLEDAASGGVATTPDAATPDAASPAAE